MGRSKITNKPVRNVIAATLRQKREAQGLSQDALAGLLQRAGWDVGRTTITKIELAERCVTDFELIVIADALDIGVETLTSGVPRNKVRTILGSLDR